jgi:signal transduction histidine kinase
MMNSSFSVSSVRPSGFWRHLRHWLADVPVADPVDRRNAPMLQIVLLVIVVVPLLMWMYRIFASDLPWRPGETTSLLMSLSLNALATFSFFLIRRGRFQWATRQLLAVVALFMIVSYTGGLTAQSHEQPIQVVWIVIAGLIVGRRALWSMYACFLIALTIGLAVDLNSKAETIFSWSDQTIAALTAAVLFLLISIVIDRSVAALRESLGEATARRDDLARVNARLEAEIIESERVREQLIHAQKVEAVGRLSAGVAHDFNHLLSLMLGYARRGRSVDDVAQLKDALSGVESAARRAVAVTETLLNFSRQDATKREVFDVVEAIAEMRPMLRQLFNPSVRIELTLPAGPIPIRFDRAQFGLIVINIAANANHAMTDGGRFVIDVRSSPASVEIDFSDSGHGMSAEVRERIFEPFFTTKPSGQGSGLGLAVAVNLVGDAGGRLSVRSEPGQGSVFVISLPHPQLDEGVVRIEGSEQAIGLSA